MENTGAGILYLLGICRKPFVANVGANGVPATAR